MRAKQCKLASRKNYLKRLDYELSLPWMKKRLGTPTLNLNLRQIITLLLLKLTETSSENIRNSRIQETSVLFWMFRYIKKENDEVERSQNTKSTLHRT